VQEHRAGEFARVLRRGAAFRFATDWSDYAAWTLDVFTRSPDFTWTAERADDWRIAWPDHVQTRYEAKAVAAGRRPTYLTFCRL
jgi:tRNA (guanine-N7-)-methyltransferase